MLVNLNFRKLTSKSRIDIAKCISDPHVLDFLSKDKDWRVRYAALNNHNISFNAVYRLLDDDEYRVSALALKKFLSMKRYILQWHDLSFILEFTLAL